MHALAGFNSLGKDLPALQRDLTIERISAVYAFYIDKGALVADAEHRAHGDGAGDIALPGQPVQLRRLRLPIGEAYFQVAAKDRLPLGGHAFFDCCRDRADRGDARDTEGKADEEDAKAGKPAPQFARSDRPCKSHHDAIRPSLRRI